MMWVAERKATRLVRISESALSLFEISLFTFSSQFLGGAFSIVYLSLSRKDLRLRFHRSYVTVRESLPETSVYR